MPFDLIVSPRLRQDRVCIAFSSRAEMLPFLRSRLHPFTRVESEHWLARTAAWHNHEFVRTGQELQVSDVCAQNGTFVPEKSNIWRDCVDGMYDWVKEHILEVRLRCELVTPAVVHCIECRS